MINWKAGAVFVCFGEAGALANLEDMGVSMDFIQLKIEKDDSILKYVKIIRQFDRSLSIGVIKQRIEKNDFVIGYDLEHSDPFDEINGIDRKKVFRNMIELLYEAGAHISIYQNEELSSIEFLDNWLETLDKISQQIEGEIERESE